MATESKVDVSLWMLSPGVAGRMNLIVRRFMALLLLALLCGIAGCSLLFSKPKPPEVFISSIHIESLALAEQVLLFRLRLHNPNDYPVPIRELTYRVELNDQLFAEGGSAEAVTLPALGDSEIELRARVRSTQLLTQLSRMALRGQSSVRYRLNGRLTLTRGHLGVDFRQEGSLSLPDLRSLPRRR